jgi:cob(I)alamin adenosyltransferase
MPRLTKIYTRKGDDGNTALSGGQRVAKDSKRVSAYGTVDELNAAIGVALAHGPDERIAIALREIQNELFHLGSDLSFREEDKKEIDVPQIRPEHVQKLEQLVDELVEVVGPLQNFILPGGTLVSAQLHVARTVCRRAERDVVALAREEEIGAQALTYLNRLSDALFVMARYENHVQGQEEPLWNSHA